MTEQFDKTICANCRHSKNWHYGKQIGNEEDDWKTGDIVYLNTKRIRVDNFPFNKFIFSVYDIPNKYKIYSNFYKCGNYTIEVKK
jgi:hypothetical protein